MIDSIYKGAYTCESCGEKHNLNLSKINYFSPLVFIHVFIITDRQTMKNMLEFETS